MTVLPFKQRLNNAKASEERLILAIEEVNEIAQEAVDIVRRLNAATETMHAMKEHFMNDLNE